MYLKLYSNILEFISKITVATLDRTVRGSTVDRKDLQPYWRSDHDQQFYYLQDFQSLY